LFVSIALLDHSVDGLIVLAYRVGEELHNSVSRCVRENKV
jgi:hypothetical protein